MRGSCGEAFFVLMPIYVHCPRRQVAILRPMEPLSRLGCERRSVARSPENGRKGIMKLKYCPLFTGLGQGMFVTSKATDAEALKYR